MMEPDLHFHGLLSPTTQPVTAFEPAALFSGGENGVVLDISSPTTLLEELSLPQTVSLSGQPVGTVLDQSGNGNDMAAYALTARPQLTVGPGGERALVFDGSNDMISCPISFLANSPNATVLIAFQGNQSAGSQYLVAEGAMNTGQMTALFTPVRATGGENILRPYVRTDAGSVLVNNENIGIDWHVSSPAVVGIVLENGLTQGFQNGVPMAPQFQHTWQSIDVMNSFCLGGTFRNTPSLFSMASVYGLIAIDRALTQSELADATSWLAQRAGISV
ncbi:MAG: hypothetical protein AAGF28_09020 [Pseudomonadota bacterium]